METDVRDGDGVMEPILELAMSVRAGMQVRTGKRSDSWMTLQIHGKLLQFKRCVCSAEHLPSLTEGE